ncbi:MAG: efflux RND transporter periplasmic adaptor subunit [Deltaproteobacteria bacterium]|nr:efflux RND transporter periplasmic adaptor subunit [Deltaproteobacteria bacterium]
MKYQRILDKTVIAAVLLLIAVAALWIFLKNSSTQTGPLWPQENRPVKVVKVSPLPVCKTRNFPGIARSARVVQLAFRVGGPLHELPVDVGQHITKGKLIAQIDQRDFAVNITTLKSQLAALQAQQKEARLQYDRYNNLYNIKAVPKAQFDHAEAAYERITAQVAATAARLKDARNRLSDTQLLAPFDGYIDQKHVENFDNVQAGRPIVTFLDCSVMEVTVSVPEELAAEGIRFDDFTCTFDAYPGKVFTASLKELGRNAQASNRTYPLTVTLQQTDSTLIRAGLAAALRITYSKNGLTPGMRVPGEALVSDPTGRAFVWVFDPKSNSVEKRPVTTGQLLTGGTEITSGLTTGEMVVTAGAHFLTAGQKVHLLAPVNIESLKGTP